MVMESLICPKPRRLVISYQTVTGDSTDGAEFLDMFLTEGGCGGKKFSHHIALSPPFYCGSPPRRVSNPVIQDVQFGNAKLIPLHKAPPSQSSSARKGGGCVRMKLGHKPAAVRIEGFDCLSRDRQSRGVSAMA